MIKTWAKTALPEIFVQWLSPVLDCQVFYFPHKELVAIKPATL